VQDKKRERIIDLMKKCVFDSGGLDGLSNVLFDAEKSMFFDYGVH